MALDVSLSGFSDDPVMRLSRFVKFALWIWTALCLSALVFEFFYLPAWDTETDELFELSGETVFGIFAARAGLVWLGSLLVLLALFLVGRARRLRSCE